MSGEATAVPAHMALRMATLNGAKALGIDNRTGSLTAGKAADIAAIDLSVISSQPVYEPVSQIVYATTRNQVSDVWVNGKHLVANYHLTGMDETALRDKAVEWHDKITAG